MSRTAARVSLFTVLTAAAVLSGAARQTFAAPAPTYDVTGHWSGNIHSDVVGLTVNIEGDFAASANHKKFTGAFAVSFPSGSQTLSLKGTLNAKGKVTAKLIPPRGSHSLSGSLKGMLSGDTITGTYHGKGAASDHGTFTIVKTVNPVQPGLDASN